MTEHETPTFDELRELGHVIWGSMLIGWADRMEFSYTFAGNRWEIYPPKLEHEGDVEAFLAESSAALVRRGGRP